MRSFLIRDILSGSSANGAGLAPGALNPTSTSSSFDCGQLTAQSLAATQARFLAKWAEHQQQQQQQQQLQASKYFEQVQQRQANLNLSKNQFHQTQQQQQLLNSLNLSHTHHSAHHLHPSHPHGLSLQLQLQQQAALAAALGPAGVAAAAAAAAAAATAAAAAAAASNAPPHQTASERLTGEPSRPGPAEGKLAGASGAESAASPSGGAKFEGRASDLSPSAARKPASFEYDCGSPASSASDRSVRAHDEPDDETDAGDEDELERARDHGRDQDEDEGEPDEIEVDGETDERTGGPGARAQGTSGNGGNRDGDQSRSPTAAPATPGEGTEQQGAQAQAVPLDSPLDALFQMTSRTFDALKRGEKRKAESSTATSSGFTAKQNAKKKRKSRTAFTNSQIYELERRFHLQKYLSPTDRDEIAMTLNLSNAQVITWFQNRRAKMKRDQEEQRRDIETAALLNMQKHIFETYHALANKMPTG